MPFLCVNLAFQKACLCMKNDKYQVWFMCHKSQGIKQNESRQSKFKFWIQVWPGIGQAQTDSSGSCFVFPHLRNIFYLVIMTDLFNQQFYKIYLLLMMKFTRPHMKGWRTVVPSVESSLTRFLTENDMSSVTRFSKSSKGWCSQKEPSGQRHIWVWRLPQDVQEWEKPETPLQNPSRASPSKKDNRGISSRKTRIFRKGALYPPLFQFELIHFLLL